MTVSLIFSFFNSASRRSISSFFLFLKYYALFSKMELRLGSLNSSLRGEATDVFMLTCAAFMRSVSRYSSKGAALEGWCERSRIWSVFWRLPKPPLSFEPIVLP